MDKFEILKNYIHSQYKNVNVDELSKPEQNIIIEAARLAALAEPSKDPNFIEKSKVIKKVIENLESSTKTKWSSGYLEDWTAYANKMKAEITASINLLNLM